MVKSLHRLDDVMKYRRSDFTYGQICCEGDHNKNKPSQGSSMIFSMTLYYDNGNDDHFVVLIILPPGLNIIDNDVTQMEKDLKL